MRKPLVLACLALAVLGAACASDPAASPAEPAEPAGVTPADPGTETPVEINEDSPIEALLGVPVFDDDAMNKWFQELDIERQRVTAECMIAQGFEFVPETPRQPQTPAGEFATSSREYAEAYGFGIGLAFNAAEYDPTVSYATANTTHIASLTEGERDAYYVALYGPQLDESSSDDGFPLGGCEGDAFRDVFSVLGVMEQLTPVVDGYYEQFLADSRMIALTTTWQRCMSDSGFVFANPDEMTESFYPALDAIIGSEAAYSQVELPDDLPDPSFSVAGDVFGYHPKLTDASQAELDAYISNEIATAVAHWDCREPLLDEEIAIQREYEAKFVAEAAPLIQAD